MSAPSSSPVQIDRFQGGGRWLTAGLGLGLLLVAAGLGGGVAMDPVAGWASYLVAFAYWCGISMASVILLQIFHATRAKWMIVLKRPVEAMGSTLPLFILLFIPIIFGMKTLYSWVEPAAGLSRETMHLLEHKRPWLNPPFFIGRAFFYIVFISFVHSRLYGWSKKQDSSGDVQLTQKQRNLGTGTLPFVGLAFTFAAFDWLMSLNPTWFSTVFGVYFFGGSFVSALSMLAVVTNHARGKDSVGTHVNAEHTHNIGKLMLAFTCFWTYIAFSQLMLIWIAGLPEETPFYITRFSAGWRGVGIFMMFAHFFLPFGALLSRSLKRDSGKLAIVATWILLVHFVDVYWLVMPTFYPEGVPGPASLAVTAASGAGIGLLAIAFGVFRQRGQYALPIKDPYLADSLRYRQP